MTPLLTSIPGGTTPILQDDGAADALRLESHITEWEPR